MMYRVSSARPVVYLADSRFFARMVQALDVNADSEEYAIRHYLKVTTGDAGEITCAPAPDKLALRPGAIADSVSGLEPIEPAGTGSIVGPLVPSGA